MSVQSEILVCQAGSCRAAGSEAVLLEIEELAAAVTAQCKVRQSGCLGMCSQAPSAVVVLREPAQERPHMRLRTVEASARVVEVATGRYPPLNDSGVKERLQEARRKRARDYAISASKWNAALKTFSAASRRVDRNVFEVEWQRAELLGNVGMWDAAIDSLAILEEQLWEAYREDCASPEYGAAMTACTLLQVVTQKVKCLGKRARSEEIERINQQVMEKVGSDGTLGQRVESLLRTFRGAVSAAQKESDEVRQSEHGRQDIENYSQWTLEAITPVSEHSAVFHFSSTDRKRGTPHPRGRGKVAQPNTWHTTLLALVGENEEGPLPWIERDYTPISSAKQWEKGSCDILIKIYPDGAATSWLRQVYCQHTTSGLFRQGGAAGGETPELDGPSRQKPRIWLSKPHKTLSVPSLADETTGLSAPLVRPASVLLILAGTGVVAVPQILSHRDPMEQLGIPTKMSDQLHVPIDLLLSCRAGDVLMLPEIVRWCAESQTEQNERKGLRHCFLLLTDPGGGSKEEEKGPFSEGPAGFDTEILQRELAKFRELPNCCLVEKRRVDSNMVLEAVSRMPQPCRVIVSGPDGFNNAVREMLLAASVEQDDITMLTA